MTTAAFPEPAMTLRPPRDPAGPAHEPAPASRSTEWTAKPGLLASVALTLSSWRRRKRRIRAFRGFDRHQLRDLGLNPLDQW